MTCDISMINSFSPHPLLVFKPRLRPLIYLIPYSVTLSSPLTPCLVSSGRSFLYALISFSFRRAFCPCQAASVPLSKGLISSALLSSLILSILKVFLVFFLSASECETKKNCLIICQGLAFSSHMYWFSLAFSLLRLVSKLIYCRVVQF